MTLRKIALTALVLVGGAVTLDALLGTPPRGKDRDAARVPATDSQPKDRTPAYYRAETSPLVKVLRATGPRTSVLEPAAGKRLQQQFAGSEWCLTNDHQLVVRKKETILATAQARAVEGSKGSYELRQRSEEKGVVTTVEGRLILSAEGGVMDLAWLKIERVPTGGKSRTLIVFTALKPEKP